MKTITLALLLLVAGCSHTLEGAKKDTRANEKQLKAQVKKSNINVSALSLTPRIKAALIENKLLNDSGNKIDVDTIPGSVYLTGYVRTPEMKHEAERVAQGILKDSKATEQLHNRLEVIR